MKLKKSYRSFNEGKKEKKYILFVQTKLEQKPICYANICAMLLLVPGRLCLSPWIWNFPLFYVGRELQLHGPHGLVFSLKDSAVALLPDRPRHHNPCGLSRDQTHIMPDCVGCSGCSACGTCSHLLCQCFHRCTFRKQVVRGF
jgi:hypothetical protein